VGLKNFVKNLVVEPDEPAAMGAGAPPAPAPQAPAWPPAQGGLGSAAFGQIAPVFAPAQPSEMQTALREELRKSVFESRPTRYRQLLDMSEKMRAAIPDDGTRLRAAISASGVTAQEVKDAIREHQAALAEQRQEWERKKAVQRTEKIDKGKARRGDLAAQRQRLMEQIQQIDAEDAQLAGRIAAHEQLFTQLDADFALVASSVERELADAASRTDAIFAAMPQPTAAGAPR
jgi:hypothetical protein